MTWITPQEHKSRLIDRRARCFALADGRCRGLHLANDRLIAGGPGVASGRGELIAERALERDPPVS